MWTNDSGPLFLRLPGPGPAGRAISVWHILSYTQETIHRDYMGDWGQIGCRPVLLVTITLDGRNPGSTIHYLEGDDAERFLAWASGRELLITTSQAGRPGEQAAKPAA